MRYPEYVKNCIDKLGASGFSAYAVGGAVRDGLLGLEPSDWDVTTSALPEQIMEVFADRRTIPTGLKHGTVTVLFENGERSVPIEITTFRIDGEYRDSRRPESVSFSQSIFDDLSRRDFTVNAMAYNEKEGIVDGFGGAADLDARIIRAVGEPETRFCEDALRILRAFRFSAQLGFDIEEKTYIGACKCAHLLKNIARERVGAEFKRLIASDYCPQSLEKMIDGGVWSALFDAKKPDMNTISRLSELKSGDFAVRLAALTGGMTDDEGAEFLNSLRLSNDEKRLILRLCRVKDFEIAEINERKAREFLHLYRDILPLAAEILRFYNDDAGELLELVECEKKQGRPLTVSELALKGNDILPLVGGEHRRVGEILNFLLAKVLDDPKLNEKEILTELAKKHLA